MIGSGQCDVGCQGSFKGPLEVSGHEVKGHQLVQLRVCLYPYRTLGEDTQKAERSIQQTLIQLSKQDRGREDKKVVGIYKGILVMVSELMRISKLVKEGKEYIQGC